MRWTKRLVCAGAGLLALLGGRPAPAVEVEGEKPIIQIAILLDTSNSMDGLIAQAKSELWKIVNEFLTVEKGGKQPELEVALYEYGNNSIPAGEGYVRLVVPLTDDLDEVSKQLFALKTNGGHEYCGAVIKDAVGSLDWTRSPDALKLVFIAGNEPFTQGTIDYRESCKAAIGKNIVVNTIFCGPHQTGIAGNWQDGAMLADGKYMNIDQNRAIHHIEAPQDKEIARLGEELNKTYIPYGEAGKEGRERQLEQERNAAGFSAGSFVQRQVTKASAYYRNAGWDLVDAAQEGKVKLEDLPEKDLPAEMQKMSVEERAAFVKSQAAKRAELQAKIQNLNEKRQQYVATKMKETSEKGESTLDRVMIQAIRTQAERADFRFR